MTALELEEKLGMQKLLYYVTHEGVIPIDELAWANTNIANLAHAVEYIDYGKMWTPVHWLANTCLAHMGYRDPSVMTRTEEELSTTPEYKRVYDVVAMVLMLKLRSDYMRHG